MFVDFRFFDGGVLLSVVCVGDCFESEELLDVSVVSMGCTANCGVSVGLVLGIEGECCCAALFAALVLEASVCLLLSVVFVGVSFIADSELCGPGVEGADDVVI